MLCDGSLRCQDEGTARSLAWLTGSQEGGRIVRSQGTRDRIGVTWLCGEREFQGVGMGVGIYRRGHYRRVFQSKLVCLGGSPPQGLGALAQRPVGLGSFDSQRGASPRICQVDHWRGFGSLYRLGACTRHAFAKIGGCPKNAVGAMGTVIECCSAALLCCLDSKNIDRSCKTSRLLFDLPRPSPSCSLHVCPIWSCSVFSINISSRNSAVFRCMP